MCAELQGDVFDMLSSSTGGLTARRIALMQLFMRAAIIEYVNVQFLSGIAHLCCCYHRRFE